MKTEKIYVVVNKQEHTCSGAIDLLQASSLLGIHRNTFKNRLKRSGNYFENNECIIAVATLYRSNKYGNRSKFYSND